MVLKKRTFQRLIIQKLLGDVKRFFDGEKSDYPPFI
jgi:hypothetical protein